MRIFPLPMSLRLLTTTSGLLEHPRGPSALEVGGGAVGGGENPCINPRFLTLGYDTNANTETCIGESHRPLVNVQSATINDSNGILPYETNSSKKQQGLENTKYHVSLWEFESDGEGMM